LDYLLSSHNPFVEVIVIFAVFFLCVEGLTSLLQHLGDLLGNLQLQGLHHLYRFLHTDSIPCLKGAILVIVAPLHGIVYLVNGIAYLRDTIRGINKVLAEIFPYNLTGNIFFRVEEGF